MDHAKSSAVAYVKSKLQSALDIFVSVYPLLCNHPNKDFSRHRKLSLPVLLKVLLTMGAGSLRTELLRAFQTLKETPSPSAFIQQRAKLSASAMPYLFKTFNNQCAEFFTDGLQLLACDGSDINVAYDPSDEETFIAQHQKRGYNQMHLNTLMNVHTGVYKDVVIQGARKKQEREALCTMIDRLESPGTSLIIADRGYESFNVFAHALQKKAHFMIRIKDISSNGILSGRSFPDAEFDYSLQTILTRRHTKETLSHPEKYTILPPGTDFDFLSDESVYYPIRIRIVRIRLVNEYICLATDLDPEEYPPSKLKKYYHLRWNEELSYRQLKYTIGLSCMHCKRKDFIYQEIYARLIMYNFCCQILAAIEIIQKGKRKYQYKANFSAAATILQDYLRGNREAADVIELIQANTVPIRPDRKAVRKIKPQSFKPFNNRSSL